MKKNRQILVLAALLFSFLCFPADKVLAASNVVEVPLTVKQNFEENSNEKGIDLTGTYEFRALDIGIPMPGDSDNDRHVFVLDGNNAEKMISLQFQHGGVYRYHLVQTSKDKGRKHIGANLKYYFTDLGLRNARLNFRQQEPTHIMENIRLSLHQMQKKIWIDFFNIFPLKRKMNKQPEIFLTILEIH